MAAHVKWLPFLLCVSRFSVSHRECGVEPAAVGTQTQCDISSRVAAKPSGHTGFDAHRRAIHCAQVMIDAIVTATVIVGRAVSELRVHQSTSVVTEHYIGPHQVKHAHVAQIDHIVGITVNIVTIAVQIVERHVKDRSESEAQNAVDYRCPIVGTVVNRHDRAIDAQRSRTPAASGRGQRTAPVVTGIIVTEHIAVRMVVVVIGARCHISSRTATAVIGTHISIGTRPVVVRAQVASTITTAACAAVIAVVVGAHVATAVATAAGVAVIAVVFGAHAAASTTSVVVRPLRRHRLPARRATHGCRGALTIIIHGCAISC